MVANREHIDSGTFNLVDAALARNREADPIRGPLDRDFMKGGGKIRFDCQEFAD
jgi:hypothetical protein